MSFANILALIIAIAAEYGLPPYFVAAIAIEESGLVAEAVNVNRDGTRDLGVMQLNSSWYKDPGWRDPAANIRAGCAHIRRLSRDPYLNTWWAVAVAYNCGLERMKAGPPESSLDYAERVMRRWGGLDPWNKEVLTGSDR